MTKQARKKSSVLSQRYFKTVCVGAVLVYFLLNALLGYNHYYGEHKICSIIRQRSSWTRDFNISVAGGFFVAICFQINRIFMSTFREENDIGTLSAYYASLCVNIISASSHFCVLFFDWAGVCVDAYGVEFPASIWPEWIVTVPLMTFITISIDDKPALSFHDIGSVLSMGVALSLGFIAQTSKHQSLEMVIFVLASIFISPVISIYLRARADLALLTAKCHPNDNKKGAYQRRLLLASRKSTLAFCIAALLPIFPLVYLGSLSGYLDADWTFVAFMFMSALTKLTFASLCVDAHLEVSHPSIALIDREKFALATRRAFLRYIFHEVRVPLNSISMGMQALPIPTNQHNKDGMKVNEPIVLTEHDLETMDMIREATHFMSDTLNDVVVLQTVEEGSLELIYRPFSIYDMFQNLCTAFVDQAEAGEILFLTKIMDTVPNVVLGDKFRIRHVLANLLSNAFKYTQAEGQITLTAQVESPDIMVTTPVESLPCRETGKIVYIHFMVTDTGCGISKEDQEEDIFQPYRNLKLGELDAVRGRGLGLPICRELVHMHDGEITYHSEVGKGTTFHVYLPLEISNKQIASPSLRRMMRNEGSGVVVSGGGGRGGRGGGSAISGSSADNSGEVGGSGGKRIPRPVSAVSRTSSAGSMSSHYEILQVPLDMVDNTITLNNTTNNHDDGTVGKTVIPSFSSDVMATTNMATLSSHSSVSTSSATTTTYTTSETNTGCSTPSTVPSTPLASSSSTTVSACHKKLQDLTVMVVDDVSSNRKLLAMLIQKKGVKNIHYAEDGVIALQLLQSLGLDQVDIVFLDNTMPNMTGLEAAVRMRALGYQGLIIGITGNSMPDELIEFVQNGADLVITKPMKPNMLDNLLTIALTTNCRTCPNKKLHLVENGTFIWR